MNSTPAKVPPQTPGTAQKTGTKRPRGAETPSRLVAPASATKRPRTAPGNSKIDVLIRARPLHGDDTDSGLMNMARSLGFDHVFDETATQADVYELSGKPAILNFVSGKNSAVFAYGQTGSGKTHTLQGPPAGEAAAGADDGLVLRALKQVCEATAQFVRGQPLPNGPADRVIQDVKLKMSMVEIYNGKPFDLFGEQSRSLDIRRGMDGNFFIPDVTEVDVVDEKGAMTQYETGAQGRRTSSTAKNNRSSRSHLIFTLKLAVTLTNGKIVYPPRISRIHFVDLAGSEKFGDTDGKDQQKEMTAINQSLSILGNVIRALGRGEHPPIRETELTKLLSDTLTGDCKMFLIICISAAAKYYFETKSALDFGASAKLAKPMLAVSKVATLTSSSSASLTTAAQEMQRVRQELEQAQQRIAALEKEKATLLVRATVAAAAAASSSSSSSSPSGITGDLPLELAALLREGYGVAAEKTRKLAEAERTIAALQAQLAETIPLSGHIAEQFKWRLRCESLEAENKRLKNPLGSPTGSSLPSVDEEALLAAGELPAPSSPLLPGCSGRASSMGTSGLGGLAPFRLSTASNANSNSNSRFSLTQSIWMQAQDQASFEPDLPSKLARVSSGSSGKSANTGGQENGSSAKSATKPRALRASTAANSSTSSSSALAAVGPFTPGGRSLSRA